MTDEEKCELSEAIFFDMMKLLTSTHAIKDIHDHDRFEIAHTVLVNLLGAFAANLTEPHNFIDEIFTDSKIVLKTWQTKMQNYLDAANDRH